MTLPQHFDRDGHRSQSETIGVVLLTGVIVLAVGGFSLLAVSNFNEQAKEDEVAASIDVEVTADNITVTHNGGDTLDDRSLVLIARTAGSEQRYAFGTEALVEPADGDGKFEPGEEFVFAHSMNGTATLLVVDKDRSILLGQKETQIPPDITIDPPNFRIRIDNTNSPITEGETLTVRPTVTNVGDTRGTQVVELSIDGRGVVAEESMTLAGGETEQIQLGWSTSVGDSGDYDATVTTVNDTDTEAVTVRTEPNFQVGIDSTNSPVTGGDNLSVTATIQNTGGSPGIQNIELNVSGQSNPIDVEEIGLNPGGSRQLTLDWSTEIGDAGSYDVTVASADTSVTKQVTVQPANRPGVTSIVMDGTPVNYTEAAASERSVTITYDEQMDTSVAPSVTLSGVSATDPATDPGWTSNTTYVKTFDIAQNDEDVTATVNVSGAQNPNGTVQNSATADFVVDTQRPGDVTDIAVKPDINITNQTAVTYGIKNPDTVYGDEDIRVTLTGPNGKMVTKQTPLQNGAGGLTNVTLDASSLDDGPVSIEAVAVDDVNNTGGTVQESGIVKDTEAPLVSNYAVVSNSGGQFTVSFDVTEETTSVTDISIAASGPGEIDGIIDSNNDTSSSPKSFSITYSVTADGEYDVTLRRILDGVGNNGSDGQTETVNTSPSSKQVTADANGPYEVVEGDSVTLDGSGSSTQAGNIDSYQWTITDGGGSLVDENTVTPTYVAPDDVSGNTTVTVELTVTTNQGGSDSTTTFVTVVDNDPGITNFALSNPRDRELDVSFDSDEQLSDINVTITRDGNRVAVLDESTVTTDDTSQPFTYTASYTASTDGTYEATLNTAADADGNDGADGETDTAVISTGSGNAPPVADAGADVTIDEGATTTLDGTGSYDSDGSISSYAWTITSGPGTLSDANTATPTYTAPSDRDSDTPVTVELTVTDGGGATDTDSMTVTVRDEPPEFTGLSATTTQSGKSGQISEVDFDWDSVEDVGSTNASQVDEVILELRQSDGTLIRRSTGNPASGVAALNAGKNRDITIRAIVRDTAGNTETCTVQNAAGGTTYTKSDFDCSTAT